MASRFLLPYADVGNGISPSDGAKLYFSPTGVDFDTTAKDTYTTDAASVANANPVVASSTGLFPDIYLAGDYKVVLKDKNDVQIWEADPVRSANASDLDYLPAGTGAAATNVQTALRTTPIICNSIGAVEATVGATDKVVYLDAGGRSGTFAWDTSNLSTEVTADTQQGIYIAPSSDATGASGAWVRRYDGCVYVDWFGAVGDGATNDAVAIQAGENYTYPRSKQLCFQNTVYATYSTINRNQHSFWRGEQSVDTGSEIWFYGPDGDNAVQAIGGSGDGISRISTIELRILDKRTTPTSGDGLHISNYDNRVNVLGCFVGNFPGSQINITSPSGSSSDSVIIDDVWIIPSLSGSIGINIERVDNIVQVRNIKGDSGAGTKLINVDNIANESAVIDISNIKHEPNNATSPTITLGQSHGNVSIENVIQRNVSGTGSDIVVITDSSAARLNLKNIAGDAHSTWGSGAQLVRIDGPFAQTVAGPRLDSAYLGVSGRVVRDLAGNGSPEASIYGNIGDVYHRLDSQAALYLKTSGAGTNTGWRLVPTILTGSTAHDIPSIAAGGTYTFTITVTGAITGDRTIIGYGGSGATLIYVGQVTSTDTVTVVVFNPTAGALDPASQTFTATVFK